MSKNPYTAGGLGYTAVPNVAFVWRQRLGIEHFDLLVGVLGVAGFNQPVTYREIAERVGMGERSVKRLMPDLLATGLVERDERRTASGRPSGATYAADGLRQVHELAAANKVAGKDLDHGLDGLLVELRTSASLAAASRSHSLS